MAELTRRPQQGFVSLRDAMDQIFSEAFTPIQRLGGEAGAASVPMNVYEDETSFHLHLVLPGVDPQAVEITAANGVLSIVARQQPLAQEGWRPVWQEFAPTEFRRQLRLPLEFDSNGIQASYEHGFLTITVPKAEHTRPRQIKVRVGNGK